MAEGHREALGQALGEPWRLAVKLPVGECKGERDTLTHREEDGVRLPEALVEGEEDGEGSMVNVREEEEHGVGEKVGVKDWEAAGEREGMVVAEGQQESLGDGKGVREALVPREEESVTLPEALVEGKDVWEGLALGDGESLSVAAVREGSAEREALEQGLGKLDKLTERLPVGDGEGTWEALVHREEESVSLPEVLLMREDVWEGLALGDGESLSVAAVREGSAEREALEQGLGKLDKLTERLPVRDGEGVWEALVHREEESVSLPEVLLMREEVWEGLALEDFESLSVGPAEGLAEVDFESLRVAAVSEGNAEREALGKELCELVRLTERLSKEDGEGVRETLVHREEVDVTRAEEELEGQGLWEGLGKGEPEYCVGKGVKEIHADAVAPT